MAHYSSSKVQQVAEAIRENAKRYEALFDDLGKEMYVAYESAEDNSDGIIRCYNIAEDALDDFRTHFPTQENIACQQGCHHCCALPVEAPPQVIESIFYFIQETFTPQQLAELEDRIEWYCDDEQAPPPKLCPFLDESGSCSIYSHRPPACRAFTSPDVTLCQRSVNTRSMVPQQPVLFRIYQSMTSALLAVPSAPGTNLQQLRFIPALRHVLRATKNEPDTK